MTRVIKSDKDYEAALGEIERLIDLNPRAGTPESDELELLAGPGRRLRVREVSNCFTRSSRRNQISHGATEPCST